MIDFTIRFALIITGTIIVCKVIDKISKKVFAKKDYKTNEK
jgi:hypothetical protein